MKEHKYLDADEIDGLQEISQVQFELYVDMLLQKNYKDLPNVIRLPNIDSSLANVLGINNTKVYLTKSNFTHFRISRKGAYNQAFREEELKAIPQMIKSAHTAYFDTSAHDNFFIAEHDATNLKKVNILVFNKDVLGSYIVTAKKIDISDLNKKEYKQIGTGVAPAITR